MFPKVKDYAGEYVEEFVRSVTNYYEFKLFTNHCPKWKKVEEFPDNSCHFYPAVLEKIEYGETLYLEIPDSKESVFYDERFKDGWEHNENSSIIKLIDRQREVVIGFYVPEKHLLLATDWTHCEEIIPQAIETFYIAMKKLPSMNVEHPSIIFSQKAKGISKISNLPSKVINCYTTDYTPPTNDQYLFLRACPKNPRHGVLENMIIPNTKLALETGVKEMFKQAIAAGEPPEIVTQPYIRAEASAVWAKGLLVIGPDNDGVTAGKEPQLTVKTDAFPFEAEAEEFGECEAEMIYHNGKIYYTQLRKAGKYILPEKKPKGAIPGFIPKKTKIIELAKYDIVEIEGLNNIEILEKAEPKKTICIHRNGNLLSHAAAHCRLNGIPYLILPENTKLDKKFAIEVQPGWVILTNKQVKPTEIKVDLFEKDFWKGFKTALKKEIKVDKIETYLLGGTYLLQQYLTGFVANPFQAYLIGIIGGIWIKLSLSLLLGEARHFNKCVEHPYKEQMLETLEYLCRLHGSKLDGERNYIYCSILHEALDEKTAKYLATILIVAFQGEWENGYGGEKWGKAAELTLELLTRRNLQTLNKLINCYHNNGWMFNKILEFEMLDEIYQFQNGTLPKYRQKTFLQSLFAIYTELPKLEDANIELTIKGGENG